MPHKKAAVPRPRPYLRTPDAGRDILGFGEIREKGGKSLIMGDPDFDMGAEAQKTILAGMTLAKKDQIVARRSPDMRGTHFKRLPGTREEAQAIHALLGKEHAELFTDKNALEHILLNAKAPKVLHLATHGFFLKDIEVELPQDSRGLLIATPSQMQLPVRKTKIENPLISSGIALSGANTALKSDDPENSDGIVTAEKILGMRLRGTDMVVLSACNTGVGDIQTGEGVYGLRRAFTQAGAKSLVMSMWPVPDRETKELMTAFYQNVATGMNRCQALRQAALKQMHIVKERYGDANPLYWGAFVFMGEPWQEGQQPPSLTDGMTVQERGIVSEAPEPVQAAKVRKGAGATCFISTTMEE